MNTNNTYYVFYSMHKLIELEIDRLHWLDLFHCSPMRFAFSGQRRSTSTIIRLEPIIGNGLTIALHL